MVNPLGIYDRFDSQTTIFKMVCIQNMYTFFRRSVVNKVKVVNCIGKENTLERIRKSGWST